MINNQFLIADNHYYLQSKKIYKLENSYLDAPLRREQILSKQINPHKTKFISIDEKAGKLVTSKFISYTKLYTELETAAGFIKNTLC